MANVNNPHGLRPLYHSLGAPWHAHEYSKVVGYATALFINDAVNRVADGSIEAGATPGTTLYSGVNLNHGAASKATTHLVIDDPYMVFEAQADGSLAAADMGLNANLVLTAGNADTLISKHQIDSNSEAVTGTLDVKLLRLLNVVDNEFASANPRIEILFNKHRMHPAVAGV